MLLSSPVEQQFDRKHKVPHSYSSAVWPTESSRCVLCDAHSHPQRLTHIQCGHTPWCPKAAACFTLQWGHCHELKWRERIKESGTAIWAHVCCGDCTLAVQAFPDKLAFQGTAADIRFQTAEEEAPELSSSQQHQNHDDIQNSDLWEPPED